MRTSDTDPRVLSAAGSAVADVFVVPDAQVVAPVQFVLQPGAGYVVGAGATVPINLNMAPPGTTLDFSGISTDLNYDVTVTVTRPQPGGKIDVDYKLGTFAVTAGKSSGSDIRDQVFSLLEDAGYQVSVATGGILIVSSTKGAPISILKLKITNVTDKAGQKPAKGVTYPTLNREKGIKVEVNGTRLSEPKPE